MAPVPASVISEITSASQSGWRNRRSGLYCCAPRPRHHSFTRETECTSRPSTSGPSNRMDDDPIRDPRRDGVCPRRGARHRVRRHIPRASVHAAALGHGHRGRAALHHGSTQLDHPCRARLPRAGRRQGAPLRGQRVDPHRRVPAGRFRDRRQRRATRRTGLRDRLRVADVADRADRPDRRVAR